jgi:uncharacterized glyoxalase superfamily protein PhnB
MGPVSSAMAKKRTRRTAARRRPRPRASALNSERVPKRTGNGSLAPTSGLAPGMQAINAYLAVANVAASATFLETALGFSRGVTLSDADGQLRYAEMRNGDSVVMLVRREDATTGTGGVSALYTYVGDVDEQLARAREAGAGVTEAEDKPWGDRVATVTDPDGYRWVLATFKKLAPFT